MTSPTPETGISPQLAHELRSPLAALIGVIDVLVDPGTPLDPGEVVELLSSARADAVHLLALVERARVPGGDQASVPVVLVDVVRRVLQRFPDVAARAAFTPDRTVAASADAGKVDQIVTNLVQNVSRYAPTGRVELRLARDGAFTVLECSDEGPGIPPDRGDGIFSPGARSSADGLHIGLATSRELAREMGGDLVLEPGGSRGTTMSLVLPSADLADTAADVVERAVLPRAKVLLDVARALEGSSPRQTAGVLANLVASVFDVDRVWLLVEHGDGFVPLDDPGATPIPAESMPVLAPGRGMTVPSETPWWRGLGARGIDGTIVALDGVVGRAFIVMESDGLFSWRSNDPVLSAVALIAGLAVARVTLERDLSSERTLRSTVMEALPIALSIFAGDPPRLVDWNAAELRLLGLADPAARPAELVESQRSFDVRFDDGRPLTADDAPVVTAIREGRPSGPFILRVRRADGTEVRTRTYCSPIIVEETVTGAVVTSELLGESDSGAST